MVVPLVQCRVSFGSSSDPVQMTGDGGPSSPVQRLDCDSSSEPVQMSGDGGLSSPVQRLDCGSPSDPVQMTGDGGPSSPVQRLHCASPSDQAQGSVDNRSMLQINSNKGCFSRSVAIGLDGSLQLAHRDQTTGEIVYKLASFSETAQADNLRALAVHTCVRQVIVHAQDEAALSADMPPNLKFKTLIDRIEHMSNPLSMIGEQEVKATAKVVGRNILVIIEGHSSLSNVMYR